MSNHGRFSFSFSFLVAVIHLSFMENNIEAEITACEWRNEALFSEFISKNYIKVNPKV